MSDSKVLGRPYVIIPATSYFLAPQIQWQISQSIQLASTGGGPTATFSVDIGAAAVDRFIICAASVGAATLINCIVNGVTLSSDVSRTSFPSPNFYTARIFSGIVASGSGVVTVTLDSGVGQTIALTVWRVTGLPNIRTTGNTKAGTSNEGAVGVTATISVNAGDYMIACAVADAVGGANDFSGSTEAATATLATTSTLRYCSAHWAPLATTNASWTLNNNVGTASFVGATYR